MNSCRSTLLSACAPPLSTFRNGTGSTCAFAPPTYRYSGRSDLVGRRLRDGERHAEDRVRTEAALASVPSSSTSSSSSVALVEGLEPDDRVGDLAVHVLDRRCARPCRRSGRRRRAARRPRGRRCWRRSARWRGRWRPRSARPRPRRWDCPASRGSPARRRRRWCSRRHSFLPRPELRPTSGPVPPARPAGIGQYCCWCDG